MTQTMAALFRCGRNCAVFATLLAATTVQAAQEQAWHFRVFLDEKPIGSHRFKLVHEGTRQVVQSEADFDVRFWFIEAYNYLHRNREVWQEGCLAEIEAATDDNGREQRVTGSRAEEGFRVSSTAHGERTLPACVMTFAYWDPGFLEQGRLLNPQTGEYVSVSVERIGTSRVPYQGQEVSAEGFRLKAGEIIIDVWYSAQRQWLALESITEGGRRLRYVAQ
ncbi:MAG: DUF6134 family protein [Gammaproteobacteria bacterium]